MFGGFIVWGNAQIASLSPRPQPGSTAPPLVSLIWLDKKVWPGYGPGHLQSCRPDKVTCSDPWAGGQGGGGASNCRDKTQTHLPLPACGITHYITCVTCHVSRVQCSQCWGPPGRMFCIGLHNEAVIYPGYCGHWTGLKTVDTKLQLSEYSSQPIHSSPSFICSLHADREDKTILSRTMTSWSQISKDPMTMTM